MLDRAFRKFVKVQDLIISFLDNPDLLSPRKNTCLKLMKKQFSNFSSVTDGAFDELVNLSNNNPQIIIDIIRETFTSEIFTTAITNLKKEVVTIADKMNFIAVTWEISPFFKFPAYLLSGCRVPLTSLREHASIFRYFRVLKLATRDLDTIRAVRNAKSHRFTVSEGLLIYKDETGRVIQISISDIESIYQRLVNIVEWWVTFIFYNTLFIPKYGILFLYTLIVKIANSRNEIEKYVAGLKDFVPDALLTQQVKISTKEKVKKNWRNLKGKAGMIKNKLMGRFVKDRYKAYLIDNGVYILRRVAYHFKSISYHLENVCNLLNNAHDKYNIRRIINWFKENEGKISNYSDAELYALIIHRFMKNGNK